MDGDDGISKAPPPNDDQQVPVLHKRRALWFGVAGTLFVFVALALGLGIGLGYTNVHCNCVTNPSSASGSSLPALKPLLNAAAPASLQATSRLLRRLNADPSDVQQRFFRFGPTNIWNILASVDSRTSSYSLGHTCSSATPIAYPLSPTLAENVTFYGQCFDTFPGCVNPDGNPCFLQFGVVGNVTYLFTRIGDGPVAARVNVSVPGARVVDVWLAVGVTSGRSCSYGSVRLQAQPDVPRFELSAGGLGFGYCGIQLAGVGNASHPVVAVNSSLDGLGACGPAGEDCFTGGNLTALPLDSCPPLSAAFSLPALGRTGLTTLSPGQCGSSRTPGGTFPASAYPGGAGNLVDVSGTATDTVNFGPPKPTSGLWQY